MLRRLLLSILVLACAAGAALASGRAPTPTEMQALERDTAAFVRATEGNRAEEIIDALPPRIIASVAKANMIAPAQVRGMLVDQTRAFGRTAKARDVEVDLSEVELSDARRNDLVWTVLPMRGTAMVGQRRVAFEATTVAILENGRWHFARIDASGQAALIQSAYPEIRGLPGR